MTRPARKSRPISPPSDPAPPDRLAEFDGVVFARERLAPIVRELLPLLREDYRENGVHDERVPFNLNLDKYLEYDLCGILQIVTARDDDILVGYIMGFINPHIDHQGVGWCILSWYWLYPEYRRQGVGDAMYKAMEKFLRSAGVGVIEGSEKIARKHSLFEHNGFTPTDTIHRKVLEG